MTYLVQTILYLTVITYLSTLPGLAQSLPQDKSQQNTTGNLFLVNGINSSTNVSIAGNTINSGSAPSRAPGPVSNFSLSGNNLLLNTASKPTVPLTPLQDIIKTKVQTTIDQKEITLGHMKGLLIKVINNTDRPLFFAGDKIVATCGNEHYKSALLSELDSLVVPKKDILKTTKQATASFVTLGWVPTIRDARRDTGPIPERYEWDEARRENEISWFGKRVLWPGDNCSGVVYFKTKNLLKGTTLEIPVESLFDRKDCALLTISY